MVFFGEASRRELALNPEMQAAMLASGMPPVLHLVAFRRKDIDNGSGTTVSNELRNRFEVLDADYL